MLSEESLLHYNFHGNIISTDRTAIMNALTQLHAAIDTRVQTIRNSVAEWPCAKGCDACCHRLAEIPTLTEAEWKLLSEGLLALPPKHLQRIEQAMVALENQASGPFVCPFLDRVSGACPVYAQRPVACRTYGFYVRRDKGLYCRDMETQVAEGTMAGLVWGNHEAVERQLVELGETHSLTEWLASMPEGQ